MAKNNQNQGRLGERRYVGGSKDSESETQMNFGAKSTVKHQDLIGKDGSLDAAGKDLQRDLKIGAQQHSHATSKTSIKKR